MGHIYFFIRGNYPSIEIWKTLAQSQFWQWNRWNLNVCECGQEKDKHQADKCSRADKQFNARMELKLVQGALRPSVMGAYEYVIPDECLPTALSILGLAGVNAEGKAGDDRELLQVYDAKPLDYMRLAVLRKIFRCKKIPQEIFDQAALIPRSLTINGSCRGLSHLIVPGVAIHLIGWKEDKMGEFFHKLEAPTGFLQRMI